MADLERTLDSLRTPIFTRAGATLSAFVLVASAAALAHAVASAGDSARGATTEHARDLGGRRTVAFDVTPRAQLKERDSWAAATTMLLSWRHGDEAAVRTVAETMQGVGDEWLDLYLDDGGLHFEDQELLLAATGLERSAPGSLTIDGWRALLEHHGPIWVTTGTTFSVQARIVVRIGEHGSGGFVEWIDAGSGEIRLESARAWIERMGRLERYVRDNDLDDRFRPQVICWP